MGFCRGWNGKNILNLTLNWFTRRSRFIFLFYLIFVNTFNFKDYLTNTKVEEIILNN